MMHLVMMLVTETSDCPVSSPILRVALLMLAALTGKWPRAIAGLVTCQPLPRLGSSALCVLH